VRFKRVSLNRNAFKPPFNFSAFSLSLFFLLPLPVCLSSQLRTPPNFSLCSASASSHPCHESRTHDAMANAEWRTHAPDMVFLLFSAFPPHFASCKARGGLVVGRTDRRSKGVATGNANELHERRQIEQHTTIVTSCHPLASPRTHNRWSQRRATTNLIENCLCINTAAYVVINCSERLCGH